MISRENLTSDNLGINKKFNQISFETGRVITDSRKYNGEEVFIGLVGPSFDGGSYAEAMAKNGCKLIVAQNNATNAQNIEKLSRDFPQAAFILVENTEKYLQKISTLHMRDWKTKKSNRLVFAVAGSNGKTTHKEMFYEIMKHVVGNRVHATRGNLNNHIGVPLTLLDLNETHDYLILEIGTNHHGEIMELCRIAEPTAGLITNVGCEHLEFLIDLDGVFKEERAAFDFVMEHTQGKGLFLINQDDDYLKTLNQGTNLINIGTNSSEYKLKFDNNSVEINHKGHIAKLNNQFIFGEHNFRNLAHVYVCALRILGQEFESKLIEAAGLFTPRNNRSVLIEKNNKTFFLDAYNANPSSMKQALESFIKNLKLKNCSLDKAFFVLGDMNELGDNKEKYHAEIGEYLKNEGVKNIVFIGRYAQGYQDGFKTPVQIFADVQSFKPAWDVISNNPNMQYYFIKASRSVQLEKLME